MGNNNRKLCDQIDCLTHNVLQAGVIRIRVIRIQCQRRHCQFVHNIAARRTHNDVLGKVIRQGTGIRQHLRKVVQLFLCRQGAAQQQICGLRKAKAVFCIKAVQQIVQVMASVGQAAFNRLDFALVYHITVYIGYAGDAGKYAGAVCISQTTLDCVFGEHLRSDQVMILKVTA